MAEQKYSITIYKRYKRFDSTYLSSDELAEESGLHPELIQRLVKLGLIDPVKQSPEPLFDETGLLRIRKMVRLHDDLGITWSDLGIIMDLLEKINELEAENRRLQKRHSKQ